MLPQKLDTTLALKAIALSKLLTKTEKAVGAAVLDHFNRKTARCDPSQETIAALLGIDRRTVNRAITKLVRIGFLKSLRHGGARHCNSYQPCWPRFRAEEDRWRSERRKYADRFAVPEMSPSERPDRLVGDGEPVSRTCSNNNIPLTSSPDKPDETRSPPKEAIGPVEGEPDLGIFGARLERRLGRADYLSWFATVRLIEVTSDKIVLSAATKFVAMKIEQWFEPQILECFLPEHPGAVKVEVVVRGPFGWAKGSLGGVGPSGGTGARG